jgi:hypothetical protein
VLRDETPRVGYWLDTSDLTLAETVDAIVRQFQLTTISTIDQAINLGEQL